jgi:hypothetical protein
MWELLELEQLGGAALGGAVDPHPGPDCAPQLDATLSVGQIDEVSTVSEIVP